MTDYSDFIRLVEAARPGVVEVDPAEARRRIAAGAVLIDVREEVELRRNPPPAQAVHLPRGQIEYGIGEAVAGKDAAVVVLCALGMRSVLAAQSLQALGYRDVSVVRGGLRAWRQAAGQPWVAYYPETADDFPGDPDG
jgi:rhodanese-related sulfurtransferase